MLTEALISREKPGLAREALIFPGQGSQFVGMGEDLNRTSKAARDTFNEADDILGTHLSKLMFYGSEDDLRQTINAQPAILTHSVAVMRALEENGEKIISPRYVAGHSVGEYSALVYAGALKFPDALKLVRERGRLMQKAGEIQEGSMAAIMGVDMSSLEQLCQTTGAQIANDNCEGQIVISGSKDALIRAMDLSLALGAKKIVQLTVSGAFHSSLMQPAISGMRQAIAQAAIEHPNVPVISNTTAQPLLSRNEVPTELVQQLCSRVEWNRSIQYMSGRGVNTFIEIGPGKVLSGLIKRIVRNAQSFNIGNLDNIKSFAARPQVA